MDSVDGPVTLVIKSPNQKYDDQTINCFLNWTVEKLKTHLSHVYPSKPSYKDQRLVYSGKLLLDHLTLKDVLRKHDEYHMVHLVCAYRSPPGSPQRPSGPRNKSPQDSPSSSTINQTAGGSAPSQDSQSASAGESSDGLRHRAGPAPGPPYPVHPAFMPGYMWSQPGYTPPYPTVSPTYNPTYSPTVSPTYNPTVSPTYSPMTLLWWQQVYARQYFMQYQMMATSTHHLRPTSDSTSAQLHQSDPPNRPPQEARGVADPDVQMNAQGGEVLNDEEHNRDWLDWVYAVSRAAILLSVVYFYSSFSRFVMVMGAMVMLYLHQAGWFPFNLENEQQNPGEGQHQDEMEAELHHDLQEMERVMDEGVGEDDGESGEEGPEDPNGLAHAGFMSSTWSFIITFFMSLIPEGPANAAN